MAILRTVLIKIIKYLSSLVFSKSQRQPLIRNMKIYFQFKSGFDTQFAKAV